MIFSRPSRGTLLCPFCRDRIEGHEVIWRCLRCRTLHHDECAREHGRCTLQGCGGVPPPVLEPTPELSPGKIQLARRMAHEAWKTRLAGIASLAFAALAACLGVRGLAVGVWIPALLAPISLLTLLAGVRDVITADPWQSWSGDLGRAVLWALKEGDPD